MTEEKPAETQESTASGGGFGFEAYVDTRFVRNSWEQNPGRTTISLNPAGGCVDENDWIEVHLYWDGPGPVWQEVGTPQRIPCGTGGTAVFDVTGGRDWYWFELWVAYPGTQDRHVTGDVRYP